MNVMFQKRDFTALPELVLQYTVERYSFDALLGPLAAVIPVHGDELELWQLVDRVRCPVKIYSDLGDCTWWGYAAEIKLNLGAWDVGVSIDSMHNAVAVAYQDENNAGQTTRTAFALDAQSIGEVAANTRLAQTFQLDNPWTAKSVSARIMKVGAPADNFVAALYAADGAGGTPGTLLGSGRLAGGAAGGGGGGDQLGMDRYPAQRGGGPIGQHGLLAGALQERGGRPGQLLRGRGERGSGLCRWSVLPARRRELRPQGSRRGSPVS